MSRSLNISEDQLTLIFSADTEEFDRVTGLTTADWPTFLNEFARREGKSFDAEIVEFVADKLYATFPKAYCGVLKQDAAKGGEKFAAMLLNLHQIALAELRRKLKIIYLLTKTRKPVSCDILADLAEEDALDLQEVLDDWEQFLRRSSDTPPYYSIYHASFQRFLHRKDVVQKAGVSLRDIETAISDNLWEDLYGDE